MTSSTVQAPARPLGKRVTEDEEGNLVIDERAQPFAPNKPPAAMFFTPVTFTCVESPNQKIIGSQRELRKADNKLQIRGLPIIRFVNSKFTARTRSEYDRVKEACPTCYEEPPEDERAGMQLYEFKDTRDRIVFSTYVWDAYRRFQKIYQQFGG